VAVSIAPEPAHTAPSLFATPEVSVIWMAATDAALTMMVPVALTLPQPPVSGIE
jgi:hypothetical protein